MFLAGCFENVFVKYPLVRVQWCQTAKSECVSTVWVHITAEILHILRILSHIWCSNNKNCLLFSPLNCLVLEIWQEVGKTLASFNRAIWDCNIICENRKKSLQSYMLCICILPTSPMLARLPSFPTFTQLLVQLCEVWQILRCTRSFLLRWKQKAIDSCPAGNPINYMTSSVAFTTVTS